MELLDPSDKNLRRAGECLAGGGLVALPTETVYGLGADVFNLKAVARIFEAKARPSFDPLIVHVASLDSVDRIARIPSEKALKLMERLWPGPLTLVMPKRPEIADLVTSGMDTVAVRFPSHPVAQAIITYSGTAVPAPSANPFGYLSPTTARHVAQGLGDRVDIIIDGGPSSVGVESTVLDMTVDPPHVLRPGGMPVESIEAVIGSVDTTPASEALSVKKASPGLLKSHYAPHTPLMLVESGSLFQARPRGRSVALLLGPLDKQQRSLLESRFSRVLCLSEDGDLGTAAAGLFKTLHELDEGNYDEIWAEKAPPRGLGPAINDRLQKASKK